MSEKILIGYLLSIKDYNQFDNIIFIFCNDNRIYKMVSLGSRKTLSKNGRNMKIGSQIEFEFFEARNPNRFSKLKKMNIINDVPWNMSNDEILLFLNNFLLLNNNNFSFKKYEKMIDLIKLNIDYKFKWLVTLFKIIESTGIKFHLSSCVICGYNKIKTTSINFYGFLCSECCYKNNEYIYDKDVNEILYLLNNKKYKEIINKNNFDKIVAIYLLKSYLNINY